MLSAHPADQRPQSMSLLTALSGSVSQHPRYLTQRASSARRCNFVLLAVVLGMSRNGSGMTACLLQSLCPGGVPPSTRSMQEPQPSQRLFTGRSCQCGCCHAHVWMSAPQPHVVRACRVDHDCRANYEANMYATRYVTPPNPIPADRTS